MELTLKDINENVDKVMHAVKTAQTKADEIEGKVNGEIQEHIKNLADSAADAIEQLNEHKTAVAAKEQEHELAIQQLKKKLARAAITGEKELPEHSKKYRDQFIRYCRKGRAMDDAVLEDVCKELAEKQAFGEEGARVEMMTKDLVAGSNPDGGYWVRPDVANFLITRVFESSPLRGVANITTISSDSLEIVIDDDEASSGGWVGEVDSRPTTDTPKIGKLTIPAHEQYAQPRVTQKMLDDAGIDIEAWLQDKVARKMARVENTAFIRGDGSEKPKGILAYPDAPAVGTYKRFTLGSLATSGSLAIDGDDVKLLQNSLKEEYQPNAIWGMRRATFGNIITLKDTAGQYIFQSEFLRDRDTMMLLGKDIVFMDDLDNVVANGYPIVYGDFGVSYTIVDRFGFRVIRDEVTEKPYILLYTTKRTGGDVTNYDGLKRLKVTP